jgi:uncharacterized RDD family membrane protein YckC
MNNTTGKTCPYCQTPIKLDETVIVCSGCGIPHHQQCWDECKGCTTYGCSEVAPTTSAQPTPMARYCMVCGTQLGENDVFCFQCGTNHTGTVTEILNKYIGFWRRFLALILDGLILMVIGSILTVKFESSSTLPIVTVNWLYFALSESSQAQATLGKRAIGAKVTDENGNRISFAQATGRHFSRLISTLILGIGYLMVGFTKKKQGLHDMIARTYVVFKH